MGEIWSKTCEHRKGQEGSTGVLVEEERRGMVGTGSKGRNRFGCASAASSPNASRYRSTTARQTISGSGRLSTVAPSATSAWAASAGNPS